MKLERNWRYLLRFSHLYLRMEVPNPAHSLSFFSLPKHCGRALLPVNVLLHSCRLHLPIVNFSPYSTRLLKTFQLKLNPRISSFFNTSYLNDSCIIFNLKLESGQTFYSKRWIRSSIYDKKKSDFPPCGKMVIFGTEFVIFKKISK